MNAIEGDFGLPPLSPECLPEFTDAGTCREWLARLPLTNLVVSQPRLLQQLRLLNRYALGADERLNILEQLLEPVGFVQDQSRRRFAGRPLPFDAAEQAAFDAAQALWQEVVTGYLHCLRPGQQATTATPQHLLAATGATGALVAMLAIYLDACQAGMFTAPMFWRQLHSIYRAAEELKVARLPVELGQHGKRTAASTYVEVLLVAAAIPHELRPRQLILVADWAQRWSRKVGLEAQPPADRRTPALCVDVDSDQPAGYDTPPAAKAALRWLDLSELRKSIKKRRLLLAQGESPEALQLCRNSERSTGEALLNRVYQCWCKGGAREDAARLRTGRHDRAHCQLVSGLDAIHFQLTGRISLDENRPTYLGHQQHEQIAVFGRVAAHVDAGKGELSTARLEAWRIVDQSAGDLHLERPLNPPGRALAGEQLVAVRLHDGEGFILGRLRWVAMSAGKDALIARIGLLPGRPEGVVARRSGLGSGNPQSCRGLFLPDAPQLGEAASFFVPPQWFAADRVIVVETPDGAVREIRLNKLVERGADYERVGFASA